MTCILQGLTKNRTDVNFLLNISVNCWTFPLGESSRSNVWFEFITIKCFYCFKINNYLSITTDAGVFSILRWGIISFFISSNLMWAFYITSRLLFILKYSLKSLEHTWQDCLNFSLRGDVIAWEYNSKSKMSANPTKCCDCRKSKWHYYRSDQSNEINTLELFHFLTFLEIYLISNMAFSRFWVWHRVY